MTKQGVIDLYTYLSTAWSLVVKPGASEGWKTAKLRELYQSYADFEDDEVLAAFQKWTQENEKFPTVKNIINEIMWSKVARRGKPINERYFMERIDNEGNEFLVMHDGKVSFTWDEFINLPCNKEHLDPDEWARRYEKRRKTVRDRLWRH